MHISLEGFTVHKRFPLAISRGTTAEAKNIWLRVEHEGIEGWGEASPPFSRGDEQSTEVIWDALQRVKPLIEVFSPWQRQQIDQVLKEEQVPSAAWAALDVALHDWLGKRVGLPLWQLWGLDCSRIVPTSVTIGINSPEAARQRVRDWLQYTDVRALKVKLGSADGIEADQAMLMAVREEAPVQLLYVDANGGWSLAEAIKMCNWLAGQGVKYVEQPLPPENETNGRSLQELKARSPLQELKARSPLPIFVDESCFTSYDIPQLAAHIDGINIKLMKAGGLTEFMRMIHMARVYGLQVMFGCYSDSVLSNTAAAHLSPLADYLDLDSHLNLVDDPFSGAVVHEGRLLPNNQPGLGVSRAVTS